MVNVKSGIGLVTGMIGIAIAILIAAAIMPVALRTHSNVNQTYYGETWGAGIGTIYFTLLPIVIVIAILLVFLGYYSKSRN